MSKNSIYNLERFVKAQNNSRVGNYAQILTSIRNGEKINKSLWHIFPRYIEVGNGSRQSDFFCISEYEEAIAYLDHSLLGGRLYEISQAILTYAGKPISDIFSERDIEGLLSCMTLFDKISPNDVFADVLSAVFNNKRCEITLECIIADTRTLSFQILTNTTDTAQIDTIVEESFPKYADTLVSQYDYRFLKEDGWSFKAFVCKANIMNDSLVDEVKNLLVTNIKGYNKQILLVSVLTGLEDAKERVRFSPRISCKLDKVYGLFCRNRLGLHPVHMVTDKKEGLNFIFIISHKYVYYDYYRH